MKKIFILAIGFFFLSLYAMTYQVRAGQNAVCFCHNVNHNPHTICTAKSGQINGHTTHVNNGTDTFGACVEPTATPAPTEEPTATPTQEPTLTPTETPEPTVTPTVTPEETPTPTPTDVPRETPTPTPTVEVKQVVSSGFSEPAKPMPPMGCVARDFKIIPTIWDFKRIDATTVHFKWTAGDPGENRYVVFYGLEPDNLQYNVRVSGLETDIGALPANQTVWASVAQTDDCGIGTRSVVVDP